MIVIDMDPRNYTSGVGPEQVQENVAELLGFDTWEDLEWDCNLAKTGGGGYHIYCHLPDNTIYKRIRSTIKGLKGVDIKKHGGYVVAPGSRHPNGEYYKWLSPMDADEDFGNVPVLGDKQLKIMLKPERVGSDDANDMYGKLTADDLVNGFLSLVPATAFKGNDAWLPIMMACNHVTGGDGDAMDAFIEWSCSDPQYSDHADKIQRRWESVGDDYDGDVCSVGTLLKALHDNSCEMGPLRKMASKQDFQHIPDEEPPADTSNTAFIDYAAKRSSEAMFQEIKAQTGQHDVIVDFINGMPDDPSQHDKAMVMHACRLVAKGDSYDKVYCTELLSKKVGKSVQTVNKMIKDLCSDKKEDLPELLGKTIAKEIFNDGKHVMRENKTFYIFRKTHWKEVEDEFMENIAGKCLDSLREQLDNTPPTLHMRQGACKILAQNSTSEDANRCAAAPAQIINCLDHEIHMDSETGEIELKPHTYASNQFSVLNCKIGSVDSLNDYEKECPLFMRTIREIFANFDDCDDLIDHVAELFGYMMQPNKNFQAVWLFRGDGGDGKSLLMNVLEAVMGDAYTIAGQELLSKGSTNSDNFFISELMGKLCVAIPEIERGFKLNDAAVKTFSEQRSLTGNVKMKSHITFKFVGNVLMSANDYPLLGDTSRGMRDRLNVIPFNGNFRDLDENGNRKADPHREKNIVTNPRELSGILKWALCGLQRLRKRGKFKEPTSCIKDKEEWLRRSNSLMAYVDECLEKISVDNAPRGANGKVEPLCTAEQLYNHYRNWFDKGANDPRFRLTDKSFKRDIEHLGFTIKVSKHGGEEIKRVFYAKFKPGKGIDDMAAVSDFDSF